MCGWKHAAYGIFIQRNTYKQNTKYGRKCGKKFWGKKSNNVKVKIKKKKTSKWIEEKERERKKENKCRVGKESQNMKYGGKCGKKFKKKTIMLMLKQRKIRQVNGSKRKRERERKRE